MAVGYMGRFYEFKGQLVDYDRATRCVAERRKGGASSRLWHLWLDPCDQIRHIPFRGVAKTYTRVYARLDPLSTARGAGRTTRYTSASLGRLPSPPGWARPCGALVRVVCVLCALFSALGQALYACTPCHAGPGQSNI